MLALAIVKAAGGYERAAKRLWEHWQAVAESGKAPAQSLRQTETLLRLIRWSLPPDAPE